MDRRLSSTAPLATPPQDVALAGAVELIMGTAVQGPAALRRVVAAAGTVNLTATSTAATGPAPCIFALAGAQQATTARMAAVPTAPVVQAPGSVDFLKETR